MQSITIFVTAFVSPFLLIFHTIVQEKVYRHLLGNKYETLTHSSRYWYTEKTLDTYMQIYTHTWADIQHTHMIKHKFKHTQTLMDTIWQTQTCRHTHLYMPGYLHTHTPLTHIPIHKERQQAQPATHINSESTHLETCHINIAFVSGKSKEGWPLLSQYDNNRERLSKSGIPARLSLSLKAFLS